MAYRNPSAGRPPFDDYLDEKGRPVSGADALGAGFMNGDLDDEDDDPKNPFGNRAAAGVPLASPRPGYAADVNSLSSLTRPEPAQMSQVRGGIPPPAAIAVPSTPHPLPPTVTPITPVFARPTKETEVKFEGSTPPRIMRGNSEDIPIGRRGDRGDDFWRRFSMIAKEDKSESSWLSKTRSSTSGFSRWVWVVGLFLFAVIAGAIALGVYVSHKSTTHTVPKAIGGKDQQVATAKDAASSAGSASTAKHVSPTNTVNRRDLDLGVPWQAVPTSSVPVESMVEVLMPSATSLPDLRYNKRNGSLHRKKNRMETSF